MIYIGTCNRCGYVNRSSSIGVFWCVFSKSCGGKVYCNRLEVKS